MKIYIVYTLYKMDYEATADIEKIFLDNTKAEQLAKSLNEKYTDHSHWVEMYEVEE